MASQSAERGQTVIRVAIEKIEPLTGSATTEEGQKLAFHGWLGLLNAFSELLGTGAHASDRGAVQDDAS